MLLSLCNITPNNDIFHSVHYISNRSFFEPISNHDILNVLNSLKSAKSPGLDGLNSIVLKKLNVISFSLCCIFNRCVNEGYFPKILEIGVIKVLHKIGPKNIVGNYRPITLVSNLSKVFQKIIKIKMESFLSHILSST